MPLNDRSKVTRIELTTPGEWVDVKTRLSKGDEIEIGKAAMPLAGAAGMDGGAVNMYALSKAVADNPAAAGAMEALTFRALELGIVAWSFDEPITPENIRRLESEDYDVITARTNELWQGRSPEADANLSVSSPEPSSAEASGQVS